METKVRNNGTKTFLKLVKYIGRYKFLLPFSILLALISTALTLYVPILIGDAIDHIGGAGDVNFDSLIILLTRAAILILITAIAQWIMGDINNRISQHISRDIRNDAFEKIERLPLSYIDSTPHGEIVNRIINDTDRVAEGLLLGFTQVFTGLLTIVGTLCFMLVINWKIALVVVFLTPLSIFIAKFIGKRTFTMFKARSECEARQASNIDEMIGNQKIVKAFNRESAVCDEFDSIGADLEKATLHAIFFSSLTNPTTRFINNLVYAAVALVGAITVVDTLDLQSVAFTIGEFSVLLSYTNQYTKPFNEISGIFAEFQNALASAERIFALIETKSESADAADAIEVCDVRGDVELANVDFSYTPDKPLIENLSISAKSGQRIAIVGPTGCGKTTIINLLMRFYDTDDGIITVDGTNIRDITRNSLRASYGMVLQDTWLMSGSIKENIAFAKSDATDEEIISAAKSAHAHSFIKRLKHGYDTKIGDGGEELSQGQKQLICIARVMLSLPPMLILDEATSSIDTRTEMRIQKAFAAMMQGRTSFIVAHRLSTIEEADIILVMKDGKIVESGNHMQLLQNKGFYSELYNSQFAH